MYCSIGLNLQCPSLSLSLSFSLSLSRTLKLLRDLLTCLVGIVQEIETKKEEMNHGITKRKLV